MKTSRITPLIVAALGLSTLSTGGCKQKEIVASAAKEMAATTPPAKEPAAATGTTDVQRSAPLAATAGSDAASVTWTDIKDHAFEARVLFFAGVKELEARVSEQVRELTIKRAAMKGNADTKDWDFAMKEMSDARSYLKSMGEEVRHATSETWVQQKEKVGQAWVRTQEAYAKVKSSITG